MYVIPCFGLGHKCQIHYNGHKKEIKYVRDKRVVKNFNTK